MDHVIVANPYQVLWGGGVLWVLCGGGGGGRRGTVGRRYCGEEGHCREEGTLGRRGTVGRTGGGPPPVLPTVSGYCREEGRRCTVGRREEGCVEATVTLEERV